MEPGIPVVRWDCDDGFRNLPEHVRKAAALEFCEKQLKPILEKLDKHRRHCFGEDFARKGDKTSINVLEIDRFLTRRTKLIVELRNVPFDQQRDILFYVVEALPRMSGGMLDATGNGAYLAEAAALKFGPSVIEVKLSVEWYRLNGPPYIEAFNDKTIVLPRDDDVLRDHQALNYVNGIIRVPEDMRFKGADGNERHGDTAIGGMLAYAASRMDAHEYGLMSAREAAADESPFADASARDELMPERGDSLW
jgi:phage FluMu gp28-like protein